MTDSLPRPDGIDDPGIAGGTDPEQRPLPPGDTAGNTGGPGEPSAAELDLPGPNDPVAWSFVQPGTDVIGPGGEKLGVVVAMLGTEMEGIFHGVAIDPASGGPGRVVPADDVRLLTPSRVGIAYGADRLAEADPYEPVKAEDR